ncbi:MAG: ATP-binding protein, partial [Solirubrobacteraceae bacterium]
MAIGEAKWGKRLDAGHLARLEKIAEVLGSRDQRPGALALFSGTGFSRELAEAAASSCGRI